MSSSDQIMEKNMTENVEQKVSEKECMEKSFGKDTNLKEFENNQGVNPFQQFKGQIPDKNVFSKPSSLL